MSKNNEARDVRGPREECVLGGTLPDSKQQAETQALTVGRAHRREEVDLSALVIPSTHQAIDPNKVDEIAQSMNEIGLLHPIVVYYDESDSSIVELVAGGHRVHAAQSLGWDFVDAVWIHDKDEVRLITITENLHRAELTVMERSEQIAEWARLTKDRQTKLAQVAPVSRGGRGIKGGVRQAARDLGLTRDKVRRAERIDAIVPEAKAAAKQAGIDDNQTKLMEVAAAGPDKQVEVVNSIAQIDRDCETCVALNNKCVEAEHDLAQWLDEHPESNEDDCDPDADYEAENERYRQQLREMGATLGPDNRNGSNLSAKERKARDKTDRAFWKLFFALRSRLNCDNRSDDLLTYLAQALKTLGPNTASEDRDEIRQLTADAAAALRAWADKIEGEINDLLSGGAK